MGRRLQDHKKILPKRLKGLNWLIGDEIGHWGLWMPPYLCTEGGGHSRLPRPNPQARIRWLQIIHSNPSPRCGIRSTHFCSPQHLPILESPGPGGVGRKFGWKIIEPLMISVYVIPGHIFQHGSLNANYIFGDVFELICLCDLIC